MGSEWHPIFLTTEVSPGVWNMQHAIGYGPFGTIELRRVGDGQLRYKVMFRGKILGWSTELEVACRRLWEAYLEEGPRNRGGIPNEWPE